MMNPAHPQFTERAAPEHLLNVLTVFLTVDGEANAYHQGTWTTFVRLTGCRVGCHWCDTKYSWSIKQGEIMAPSSLIQRVEAVSRGCKKITLTGGEPLEQDGPALRCFLRRLLDHGYRITCETAGTHDIHLSLIHI